MPVPTEKSEDKPNGRGRSRTGRASRGGRGGRAGRGGYVRRNVAPPGSFRG